MIIKHLKKFFWILSGDDYFIIGSCSKKTQQKFMYMGILVALIFVLCFGSSYLAFSKLVENQYLGFLVGCFVAFMITNIYLFLLYTFSKTGFPYVSDKKGRYISTIIRLSFIGFIGVIIAKPIEAQLFSSKIDSEIELFKEAKLAYFDKTTRDFFEAEIIEIKNEIEQLRVFNYSVDSNRILFYNKLIQSKEEERDQLIGSMHKLVNKSSYYLQGIIILNTHFPICWLITFFIVFVMMVPPHLKIFISNETVFYKTKHRMETLLVRTEYENFKKKYHEILREKYKVDHQFIELFSDPPFNTRRKTENGPIFKEDDLLERIYA